MSDRPRRRPRSPSTAALLTALAVLAGLATSGCAVPTNDEPQAIDPETVPFELLESTTTTTPTTIAGGSVAEETLYFLRSESNDPRLAPVVREFELGHDLDDVLTSLIDVRPSDDRPEESELTSSIPEAVVLRGAELDPGTGVLTVDLSGLFGPEGLQSGELIKALGQIVWTATGDDRVESVRFENEGEPVQALVPGGEVVNRAVDRNDYRAMRP